MGCCERVAVRAVAVRVKVLGGPGYLHMSIWSNFSPIVAAPKTERAIAGVSAAWS
jgi:hypothetical protein